MTLAFLPNIGWLEMTVIGVVLLLLFGRRLPEVGRSLGQGIVEFKKGLKDVTDDIKKDTQDSSGSSTPQFDSAHPPKNPDMLTSAHSSMPVADSSATKEPSSGD